MNEWVIQTFIDINIPTIAMHHPEPYCVWSTWKQGGDEDGEKEMRPTTLEEALERAASFIRLIKKHKELVAASNQYNFRLYNVKTKETIPLDALGL